MPQNQRRCYTTNDVIDIVNIVKGIIECLNMLEYEYVEPMFLCSFVPPFFVLQGGFAIDTRSCMTSILAYKLRKNMQLVPN